MMRCCHGVALSALPSEAVSLQLRAALPHPASSGRGGLRNIPELWRLQARTSRSASAASQILSCQVSSALSLSGNFSDILALIIPKSKNIRRISFSAVLVCGEHVGQDIVETPAFFVPQLIELISEF